MRVVAFQNRLLLVRDQVLLLLGLGHSDDRVRALKLPLRELAVDDDGVCHSCGELFQ